MVCVTADQIASIPVFHLSEHYLSLEKYFIRTKVHITTFTIKRIISTLCKKSCKSRKLVFVKAGNICMFIKIHI